MSSETPSVHERQRGEIVAEIPRWYSPGVHLAVPAALGLAATLGAIVRVHGLRPIELLAVPITLLLAFALERRTHKSILHRRMPLLSTLYVRHAARETDPIADRDKLVRRLTQVLAALLTVVEAGMGFLYGVTTLRAADGYEHHLSVGGVLAAAGLIADRTTQIRKYVLPNHVTESGKMTLPNGWHVTPAGRHIRLAGDLPMKMIVTRDGKLLVNTAGWHDHDVNVIDMKSEKLEQSFDVGKSWDGMSLDPATGMVYISSGGTHPSMAEQATYYANNTYGTWTHIVNNGLMYQVHGGINKFAWFNDPIPSNTQQFFQTPFGVPVSPTCT